MEKSSGARASTGLDKQRYIRASAGLAKKSRDDDDDVVSLDGRIEIGPQSPPSLRAVQDGRRRTKFFSSSYYSPRGDFARIRVGTARCKETQLVCALSNG